MRDEWVGTSETDPIQVDFLPDDEVGTPGRLGMTFAPSMRTTGMRGRWERDLATDMRALEEEYETDILISLMEDHEYRGYRIPEHSVVAAAVARISLTSPEKSFGDAE